jgi:hypothetical protein
MVERDRRVSEDGNAQRVLPSVLPRDEAESSPAQATQGFCPHDGQGGVRPRAETVSWGTFAPPAASGFSKRKDSTMHDQHEHAEPPPEARRLQGEVEYRSLTRSLAQDIGAVALTAASGIALKAGADLYDGAKAKAKDVLKPEPSKIELPPGVEE